jgi:hypothetical protein
MINLVYICFICMLLSGFMLFLTQKDLLQMSLSSSSVNLEGLSYQQTHQNLHLTHMGSSLDQSMPFGFESDV